MKCLVLEANELLRIELCGLMSGLGFGCIEAATAATAEYYLKTHEFDLILLDDMVDDGTTLGLVDYLQVTGTRATVILIAGARAYPCGEHIQIAPRIEFLLRKPLNTGDLCALVEYTRDHAA